MVAQRAHENDMDECMAKILLSIHVLVDSHAGGGGGCGIGRRPGLKTSSVYRERDKAQVAYCSETSDRCH